MAVRRGQCATAGPAQSGDGYTFESSKPTPLIRTSLATSTPVWDVIKDSVRNSAFLVAISAPWIVMFTVLPQMHERYLVWGAALSAMT